MYFIKLSDSGTGPFLSPRVPLLDDLEAIEREGGEIVAILPTGRESDVKIVFRKKESE